MARTRQVVNIIRPPSRRSIRSGLTMANSQAVWLVIGLVTLTFVANCKSPLWTAIKKIQDTNIRQFVADNVHIATNFMLMLWACTDTLTYAVAALLAYMGGSSSHPLDYLIAGFILFAGQKLGRRQHFATIAAFILVVAFNFGILPTSILNVPAFTYGNCSTA